MRRMKVGEYKGTRTLKSEVYKGVTILFRKIKSQYRDFPVFNVEYKFGKSKSPLNIRSSYEYWRSGQEPNDNRAKDEALWYAKKEIDEKFDDLKQQQINEERRRNAPPEIEVIPLTAKQKAGFKRHLRGYDVMSLIGMYVDAFGGTVRDYVDMQTTKTDMIETIMDGVDDNREATLSAFEYKLGDK